MADPLSLLVFLVGLVLAYFVGFQSGSDAQWRLQCTCSCDDDDGGDDDDGDDEDAEIVRGDSAGHPDSAPPAEHRVN